MLRSTEASQADDAFIAASRVGHSFDEPVPSVGHDTAKTRLAIANGEEVNNASVGLFRVRSECGAQKIVFRSEPDARYATWSGCRRGLR